MEHILISYNIIIDVFNKKSVDFYYARPRTYYSYKNKRFVGVGKQLITIKKNVMANKVFSTVKLD